MVNHRNISAGEYRWRVQLASLRHGEMTQHVNHFHYYVDHVLKLGFIISQTIALAKHLGLFLNILITHSSCFPKCCEVVTTLHEQFGQVEDLWFDSHIVRVTIFIQPQLKTWPCFVPQSFVTSSVISVVSVANTPASVHRSFLFWTCAYYFLLLSPWARGRNFPYRYHLWWQRLVMIFIISHVSAIYFDMIALSGWQLKIVMSSYIPTPNEMLPY